MVNSRVACFQGEADASATTTANTTMFFICGVVGGSLDQFSATENITQALQKNAGIVSDFSVGLTANGVAGTSHFTFRINGVDGNMDLSIPASTTGNFTLATPEATVDIVASGDLTNAKFVPGATTGTVVIRTMKTLFLNTSSNETISRLSISGFPTVIYNTASATLFEPVGGETQGVDVTAETTAKCRVRKPGTVRNAALFVQTNARSTATTYTLMKNGVATAVTISGAGGTTGWLEDTAHSFTVAAGDDIDWKIVVGTGTGTNKVSCLECDFVTTDGWFPVIVATADAATQASNLTRFCPVAGFRDVNATEANLDVTVGSAFTFAELTANVTTNGIAAVSTITARSNAANTALTVSTTASTIALLNDSTHSFTTVGTEKIDYQISTLGASGTIKVPCIMMWGQEIVVPQTVMVEWEEM